MKLISFIFLLLLAGYTIAQNSKNRITFNNQEIFLSGANIAWISFANDIGPDSETNLKGFKETFKQVHENGGNSMRIWLHTTGAHSPVFNEAGEVTGPGESTIEDIRAILDAAWEENVGLVLCLWSFDMLRIRNGDVVTGRAKNILSNPEATKTYINKSLIPMVKELKGHPGIIAWEIFNEPEGMSEEFGWEFNHHVPMSYIQRFINLCSGAIHRTDPKVQVTNGSWSFYASTDAAGYKNYYTNERLIEAGGDKDGILDFYTVHYYSWAKTEASPFHHNVSYWELDKPLAVTEFAPRTTFGVVDSLLFDELYKRGYAGAQAWSWTDSRHPIMLSNMKDIFNKYPREVTIKK